MKAFKKALLYLCKRVLRAIKGQQYKRLFESSIGKQPCLVAYLPQQNRGWILYLLWRDLQAQFSGIKSVGCDIAGNEAELREFISHHDIYVVAMGLKFLNELIEFGVPEKRIVLYHTHVRLGLPLHRLEQLHGVLVLNHFEQELVAMRKVNKKRIHVFPAGYDPCLFANNDQYRVSQECGERYIDVLFVGRYREGSDGYYHKRKRYALQVEISNRLIQMGLTVAILGHDWQNCEYSLDHRVRLIDLPHSETPKIYKDSRLVCSVAAQEGGPVSFLEGMASGCLMLSSPTGFPADIQSGKLGSWLMPLRADSEAWCMQIMQLLSDNELLNEDVLRQRSEILRPSQFSSLSRQLVSICFSDHHAEMD